MSKKTISVLSIAALAIFTCGCNPGGGTESTLTKDQENAVRHPVADPNYKGPSAEGQAKMQQSIADFNAKHKNDKVEFTK